MHLVGLLVLAFLPCCISRAAFNDNSKRSENLSKEQEQFSDEDPTSAAPVNGQQGDGPLKDTAKYGSPFDGVGGEENPKKDSYEDSIFEDEGKLMVNGENSAPGQEYHFSEIETFKVARDEADAPAATWVKYTAVESWCTSKGRTEISRGPQITVLECQKRCHAIPGCNAVEFWENYNWACFQCTDTLRITPYPWTNDLAYPVYVWVSVWRKYTSYTSWCGSARTEISRGEQIDHIECQKRCQAISGCNAIEFWEKYNWACFQCTDTSRITPYTWTHDLAYPVYVWGPLKVCTFDFEAGINGWEKTGTVFNNQPTYGDNPTARNSSGPANQQGDWWIGGFEDRSSKTAPAGQTQGDGPKGTLTSPFFSITGKSVSFLIGGGCDMRRIRAQLIIDNKAVRQDTGNCTETMTRKTWDVEAFIGKRARVKLVDASSCGHINFDDFRGDIGCY